MYKPPYNIEEIKRNYPDKADFLLKDEVHFWRASTGIELIHKEPTLEEQERILENWKQMSDDLKEISNQKSIEIFGKNNLENHEEIMRNWK